MDGRKPDKYNKKMKVLFFGGLACGGAEHQMVIVAKQLAERGFEVLFVTQDGNGFFREDLDKSKVRVVVIPRKRLVEKAKFNILYFIFFLNNVVKKEKVEVGVSFLAENNFVNCVVGMLTHGKYKAITGLRNARESLLLSKRELLYTKFERFASIKICNSDNAKRMYAKYFPQYTNQLDTIYNIVNLPEISSKYLIRQNGKVHFIVPASYREVKNPYGLLEALRLMSDKELSMFDITWYGQSNKGTLPYYIKLKKDIENNNLHHVFILKDATTDIANRMNEADVVALFSSSEGLPNAICEGMMLGKPIVMTRVSDYAILVDKSNGCLCDWNDPESIKKALFEMVLSNNETMLAMGKSSRDKAVSLFSEESNIGKWAEIVENVKKGN